MSLPPRASSTTVPQAPPPQPPPQALSRPDDRPPPMRPPHRAAAPVSRTLDELPELPDFAAAKPKRNLTLVGLWQAAGKPSTRWGRWLVGGLAVALVCASATSLAYRKRLAQRFMAASASARPEGALVMPHAELTPAQRAAAALAAGGEAYAARDYGRAVASFEQALNLDPSLSEAHRGLGIVHAALHDDAEAVAHYEQYLQMQPHAKDAKMVKQIVDDYHAAHDPPPAATPAPAAIPSPAPTAGAQDAARRPASAPSHRHGRRHRRPRPPGAAGPEDAGPPS